MRPIKFRGFTMGEEPRWIYGSLDFGEFFQGEYSRPAINYFDAEIGFDNRLVAEKSVGQFTGMEDGLGNEIYEGDIIETTIFGHTGLCVVEWDEDALVFVLRGRDGFIWRTLGELVNFCMVPCHVVGNMFENKEMMEGGEG